MMDLTMKNEFSCKIDIYGFRFVDGKNQMMVMVMVMGLRGAEK